MDEYQKLLYDAFIEEALDGISGLEERLLTLESSPDDLDLIDSIFRHVHNIKSSSLIVGYKEISDFAHHIENLLDLLRNGRLKVKKYLINLILSTVDVMKDMINALGTDTPFDFSRCRELVDQMDSLKENAEDRTMSLRTPDGLDDHKLSILIVEDEFTSRTMIQGLLREYGDCDIAVNGNEAVEAFSLAMKNNSLYDIIFLDLVMPGVDGLAVLKRLREYEAEYGADEGKKTKIVITTVVDEPKVIYSAYNDYGCTDYLIKPVTKGALVSLLVKYGYLRFG